MMRGIQIVGPSPIPGAVTAQSIAGLALASWHGAANGLSPIGDGFNRPFP